MKILGIDAATKVAGIGIVNENEIVAEARLNTGRTHSERLLPLLNELLKNSGVTWAEISALAVTIGPGSFTGLRIGLATAQGLAQVLDKPIVGVVTLDALAENLRGNSGLVCPLLDARRDEVYTALYRSGEKDMTLLTSYRAIAPATLVRELLELDERITFLGDGVLPYRDLIKDTLGQRALFAPPVQNLLRGGEVAYLGMKKFLQGEGTSLLEIRPFYLRLSEAEIKWKIKHKESCS